ncbi:MAG: prephenate dehydratase [Clostridiales bacterium]|nr:prephenate dehydratase [Clostridiales bacterium]
MRIGYLGDENSHTYAAATAFAKDKTVDAFCGFGSVSDALAAVGDSCDIAVVPVENSIEGTVAETVDCLGHAGLFIVAELVLPVRQALVVINGGRADRIERVYSHPQALAQCRQHIREILPKATPVAVAYTSAALDLVDEKSAAIARVAKAGQAILVEDMGDAEHNRTRFLAVGKTPQPVGNKASVTFTLPNEPGALLCALNVFAAFGANMTKIESRPDKKQMGSYEFYVDFVFAKGQLNEILAALAGVTRVTYLGRYDEYKA